ncbi:efflux RND transporter periplasmic adaptor subunit [Phragmitibacter flavus]|nr:efflux RND transporter periplasmic adaptor subunit [Phragmitibacter flavus]
MLAAIVAVFIWRKDAASSKTNGPPPAPAAIAVLATQVTTRDVPIWLTGIGTVQAFNTVTVRPRVSGALEKVNFTEGSMVKEGDILAHIDPRPYQSTLDQALARQAQNAAQLRNARQELARVETLIKERAVSEQNLDQAQATVAQFEAVAQADTAAIAAAQLDLDFTTVRAPISGRTGIRQLDAGNVVTANQPAGLVMLTQLQPITVLFTLPQQHLPALRAHMQPGAAPLTVQAIGEDGTLLDEGKLELVDNQIDMTTGTLKLKAVFSNEKLALWPGQFITSRVLVDTRKDATVVPPEVIQPGLDGPFAYLIKPDNTVEARPLQTGLNLDGWTIIEKGLNPGDRVVRDGQNKLKPGSLVSHKEVQS